VADRPPVAAVDSSSWPRPWPKIQSLGGEDPNQAVVAPARHLARCAQPLADAVASALVQRQVLPALQNLHTQDVT
jgi:hypothetical protein